MPFYKMKKIWDYCTYNKLFFLLIFLLFAVLDYFWTYYFDSVTMTTYMILIGLNIVIGGYGMTIARDRMNGGFRLPKIMIKDILFLGIKSLIVSIFFVVLQSFILDVITEPLDFPDFDLEDLLVDLPNTLHTLFSHNPTDTLIFIVFGTLLFYITTFFVEIALARLADTGSMKSAFNVVKIKDDIISIGVWSYAKEYTVIVLSIVLFALLKYVMIPIDIINYIWYALLDLLMVVTQYYGIGNIYYKIKKKKINNSSEESN